MSKLPVSAHSDAQFWKSYQDCLVRLKINPEHHRWYQIWCQQFIKFMATRPLDECQPEHVSAFLHNLRDNPTYKDWQYQQARSALWCLFRDFLKISWAVGEKPQPGKPLSCDPQSSPAELSAAHQDTLKKLRSTLIGRQYAKRTVIAYIEWATRFLAFYPQRKIADLDAVSVKTFVTIQPRGNRPIIR